MERKPRFQGRWKAHKALWKIPEDLGKEMFEDETEPS
jgi:hypothetical protein